MRVPILTALTLVAAACRGQSPAQPAEDGGRWDRLTQGPLREPDVPPSKLAPLASLGRDGMRVTIAPSFGRYRFAVDFVPEPFNCFMPTPDHQYRESDRGRICEGVEVRYSILGEEPNAPPRRFRFRIPEEEFREALWEFDRLAQHWRGSAGMGMDGTGVSVEQYRGGRLRSMQTSSNVGFSPDNPALQLLPYVHRMLLAYGPTGTVPISESFTVNDMADYPCMPGTFNTPDPDGFGTGDDACARQRASRAAPPAP